MRTSAISSEDLSSSVFSVPPLARRTDGVLNLEENRKIVGHLEAGGVTTMLYGGNAVLYHVSLSEYVELLKLLTDLASAESLVIPSVGPSYGVMMDQASILRDFEFPTAMILPTRDVMTPEGVGRGVRKFVECTGRPAVLYIKHDGYVDLNTVQGLMADGAISFIKYAVVRENPSEDPFLRKLVDAVGASRIVSGIGEQPAIVHLREFGLTGFTSGCVCVAPKLSMNMLRALQAEEYETAEQIRSIFHPLEHLRNSINPVRVLHAAVALAGIAETGPLIPLLSDVDEADRSIISEAAAALLEANQAA